MPEVEACRFGNCFHLRKFSQSRDNLSSGCDAIIDSQVVALVSHDGMIPDGTSGFRKTSISPPFPSLSKGVKIALSYVSFSRDVV